MTLAANQHQSVLYGLIDVWLQQYGLGVGRRQCMQAGKDVESFFVSANIRTLAGITVEAVVSYLCGMRARGLSAATIRTRASSLSRFCAWCVDRGYMTFNPALAVSRPKRDQPPPVWLNERERRAALTVARETGGWPEIALALATGMRIGEIIRLRWLDVDLDNRTAMVERSKSGHPRCVPLNTLALAALREQQAISQGFTWVFPARKTHRGGFKLIDKPRSYQAMRRLILPLQAAIPRFSARRRGSVGRAWHALRHTFGAVMAQANIGEAKIGQFMGHSSIQTTQIYTRLAKGYDPDIEAANFGGQEDGT